MKNINEHTIGTLQDWKFGLITREVYRAEENLFEINDFSNGWKVAIVNQKTLSKLMVGKVMLTNLKWE